MQMFPPPLIIPIFIIGAFQMPHGEGISEVFPHHDQFLFEVYFSRNFLKHLHL